MSESQSVRKVCPSCTSQRFLICGTVNRSRIISGYASKHLGVDVGASFPQSGNIELLECGDCGLRWYWPMTAGGPEFYEALQQHEWYYQGDKPEYLHAATLVPSLASVLEVGCGRGAFASHLKSIGTYKGLEFNQAAIDKAITSGLNVVKLPIEEEARLHTGQYDVVCHFQVLEHIPDCLGFMRACADAVKPGGMMIVTVPSEDSFLSASTAGWLNMPPHHVSRWTDSALSSLFERVGFSVSQIWHEPVADFHEDWYRATMQYVGLSKLLHHSIQLDDRSMVPRITRRLVRWSKIGRWLQAVGERDYKFRSRGHSVCFLGIKDA